MNERKMVKILKGNYSLTELEERLSITPEDLEDGYLYFVEENYEVILEMLKEDLFY